MVFYTPGCFATILVYYIVFLIAREAGLKGFMAYLVSFGVSLVVLSWIGRLKRMQAERERAAREAEQRKKMEGIGGQGPDDLMARAWVSGERRLAISLGNARLHAYVAAADGAFTEAEVQRILGLLGRWNSSPLFLQLVYMDLIWFSRRMNIESVCKVLKEGVTSQAELLALFQSAVAMAAFDGAIDERERRALNVIADLLGIPPEVVEESIRLESGSRYYRQYAGQSGGSRRRSPMNDVPVSQHYRTLGLSPGASPDEVKRAYREMARKYHPDMVAGMNDEFKKMAEEKFKAIQAAYEAIRKSR